MQKEVRLQNIIFLLGILFLVPQKVKAANAQSEVANALNLSFQIHDNSKTAGQSANQESVPASAVYDLKNTPLTELNFDVGSTPVHLAFIKAPWGPSVPVISDLSLIPGKTTQFTITIAGYDVNSKSLMTLSDLQAAIADKTWSGFYAYVYDQTNNLIGRPIEFPISVASQLAGALQTGTPSVALGVNSAPVTPTGSITYPIMLTIQNIAGWNPKGTNTSTNQSGEIVYDLKNAALIELNVDIGSVPVHLPFISSPWGQAVPVISDLSFMPKGTTQFTISIQAYNNVLQSYIDTFSEVQDAISKGQLGSFSVDVINAGNISMIAEPILISSTSNSSLFSSLLAAFKTGMPNIALGVNGSSVVSSQSVTYPIQVTLKNIGGWDPYALSLMQYKYNIPSQNVITQKVTWSLSSVPGWNWNINYHYGHPGESGWTGSYTFIEDPWNKTSAVFNNGKGVAADLSSVQSEILAAYNAGSFSMMLVASDSNNNFVSDLTKNTAKNMMLFIFDQVGNLIGNPISFSVNSAVGVSSVTFSNNQFAMGGLGLSSAIQLTYPFVLIVQKAA